MGGNTYIRKNFNEIEITNFVEVVIQNPLCSLRTGKVFNDEKSWRADVARLLDQKSSQLFYFLLETYNKNYFCNHCNFQLGIESFKYSGSSKGFSKYCQACTKIGVWRKSLSPEQLKERGKKIKEIKLKFYQTTHGKEVAKETGQKNSKKLKSFFKTPEGIDNIEKIRKHNQQIMKEKILSGKFTPNSNNKNTHWDSYYKDKKFRSSWEALYQFLYPNDEHEKLRIAYKFKEKTYIYIVDFINYNDKIVTEVKPKEMCNDQKFIAKFNSLQSWCKTNDFTARIATQEFLVSHPFPKNLQDFDSKTIQKIKKLYETTKN